MASRKIFYVSTREKRLRAAFLSARRAWSTSLSRTNTCKKYSFRVQVGRNDRIKDAPPPAIFASSWNDVRHALRAVRARLELSCVPKVTCTRQVQGSTSFPRSCSFSRWDAIRHEVAGLRHYAQVQRLLCAGLDASEAFWLLPDDVVLFAMRNLVS